MIGGESGKVHSTVRERWNQNDIELIEGMKTLGNYTNEAIDCLNTKNYHKLADLMDSNFTIRRKLYSDEVVGYNNILMAELAQKLGFAVKFTGSGGAFVCLKRNNNNGLLSIEEEMRVIKSFETKGFKFEKIIIPNIEN